MAGVRVTVMGLGVHGGGLSAVRYLVDRGAEVTVTDLRSEQQLEKSVAQIPRGVRTVLGTHQVEDFRDADVVVKNPAVPRSAPMLNQAPAVTTDIALFLAEWLAPSGGETPPGPLVAITGTKGKSSTTAATAHLLKASYSGTKLGGNITVSPLSFLGELRTGDPVVLELSSFQLGDLAFCRWYNRVPQEGDTLSGRFWARALNPVVPATVAVITNIFRDHQDYYHSMERYVEDKREIYRHLAPGGVAIFGNAGDSWGTTFVRECRRRYGAEAVVSSHEIDDALLPDASSVAGEHSRGNLRIAAQAARAVGVPIEAIRDAAATFPGVPHRLEPVARLWYATVVNDSAATIPEAALAAVRAFPGRIFLIAGGSDKGLDTAPLITAAEEVISRGGGIFLLAGSATTAISDHLSRRSIPFAGPYTALDRAFSAAADAARGQSDTEGGAEAPVILLSPGCASFGMFANEFDRGDQFRALAHAARDAAGASGGE
ncbi:MAG: UDP-N-acetylmuramoyl-L-alanine--D-glutamate ligase [Alkalispirochaeta sp.]